jgi:hydroxypyruvate reductase
MNARRVLLELFDAALRAASGRERTAQFLRDIKLSAPVAVFAVGKAASAMARGARDALGAAIHSMLVVTKHGHSDPELAHGLSVLQLETAHPVPDDSSLAAGAELESRLATLPPDVLPLFLVSGGSSSLIELLAEDVSLSELQSLNERGLAAGWDIAALNSERAKLSRLKAGGVARMLRSRRALALFISDVPADDPDVIGSGLLGRSGRGDDLIERHVIANVDTAVRAAVEAAQARGLEFQARARRFDGDAAVVAEDFLATLRATSADGLVWGGESTVKLPQIHGRGGRNTHLALTIARALRPGEKLSVLAAGTDGTDGPTSDAGAIVDADSTDRASLAGCDVERAWREFDSGTALEAAEDLVHTGPTGTNVGDILIGIKHSARPLRGQPLPRML